MKAENVVAHPPANLPHFNEKRLKTPRRRQVQAAFVPRKSSLHPCNETK